MMNKTALALTALLAVSCSPVTYDIAVDVRKPSELSIDLKGCPPSVVCVSDRNVSDSVLVSRMALGIAEKLEKDLLLQEGDIPVFTMFSDELNSSDADDLAHLLTTAGSDRVIILDSLRTGEPVVEYPADKTVHDYRIMCRTLVSMPFSVRFKMVSLDSLYHGASPSEASAVISDRMKWTLLSEEPVGKTKAISRALAAAPGVFHDMGAELGAMFSPQWEEQERMLISYEDTDWDRACMYARDFKWEEAMKIWLVYAGSSSPRKASYAAYDIAVACELMEQYDLALEWLETARGKFSFREIALERANVENAMKNKK